MKTKRGIYLNLNESDYKTSIDQLTFYFSSKLYLQKFLRYVDSFIDNEANKLYNRYKINNNNKMYFMVAYYKRVEKRGFRIVLNNKTELKENVVFKTNIE